MACAYCNNITVCAICGKGYAEAVRAPCSVCGTPYMKHGTYPTCASHPYSADGRCGHVGTFADGRFTGVPCAGAECKNGCVRATGVRPEAATGTAPLPGQSPVVPAATEAEILGMAEDYGQWMWDAGYMDDPTGETLVDDAAARREEIKQALQKLVHDAYAEGRKDQLEEQPMPQQALELLDEAEAFAKSCYEGSFDREEVRGCGGTLYFALRDYLRAVGYAWVPKSGCGTLPDGGWECVCGQCPPAEPRK